MCIKKLRILLILISVFFLNDLKSQTATALPRSYPEHEGISSTGILQFVDAVEKSENELHSFMILRHGKVVAEGWWDPYKPTLKHTLYSTSKTFTSTAVGLAISENRFKLSDKVISFFPHDLPDTVSEFLNELTVKDALVMSDGQEPDPTAPVSVKFNNWARGFLSTEIKHKPGSVFLYNSMGTFMLSAIVQKVTGQKEIDYLKPRLFDPLGITGMDWEENLQGINTGGWGLRLKTEDMAKLGQLYLQKGMWNGNQILPASWVAEASTTKIIQHPDMPLAERDTSDWEQGYCYQMWRCRHNAYRADGAFGQFIIIMPDQDAVIAIQAETPSMQDEINLVWRYLLPAMHKDKISDNPKAQADLKAKLSTLALAPAPPNTFSSGIKMTTDRNYVFEPNDKNIETFTLQIRDSICRLQMKTSTDNYSLVYGSAKWKIGQTNKLMATLVSSAKENYALLLPSKIAGSYYWKDDQTLVLVLRYIESPHTETTTCHFDGNKITVDIENSWQYGTKKTVLNGVLK
jgi:CubicO group peptidase (beta-lactamase class C family)